LDARDSPSSSLKLSGSLFSAEKPSFYLEHRRGGEPEAGVEDDRVRYW